MKLKKFYEYFKMGNNPVYFITPPIDFDFNNVGSLTKFNYWYAENPNTKKKGFLVELPKENEEKFFHQLLSELELKWPCGTWSIREKTW
jgi:hypothetical protein